LQPTADAGQHLTVMLGGETYAPGILNIKEIIDFLSLPCSSTHRYTQVCQSTSFRQGSGSAVYCAPAWRYGTRSAKTVLPCRSVGTIKARPPSIALEYAKQELRRLHSQTGEIVKVFSIWSANLGLYSIHILKINRLRILKYFHSLRSLGTSEQHWSIPGLHPV